MGRQVRLSAPAEMKTAMQPEDSEDELESIARAVYGAMAKNPSWGHFCEMH